MTHKIKYLVFFLAMLSGLAHAADVDNRTYWQCSTQDSTEKTWTAKSEYQKAALNLAFASCKKESTMPTTCTKSQSSCEGFNLGLSDKPTWRCTALDEKAEAWRSNVYLRRDDAAYAAKAFCKERSSVPDSCYTNFVTCVNLNDGVSR